MPSANPEIDVAKLLSNLYLPETTFATKAIKTGSDTALVTHTLTAEQCDLGKTAMLAGPTRREGNIITGLRQVTSEVNEGHFILFQLLAGHQGFGMLIGAGSFQTDRFYNQMWWTKAKSINWQSPATTGDEMTASATVTEEDDYHRIINGKVLRGGSITHTRASGIVLEKLDWRDSIRPHLPQNAWLEVAAHFGGGAVAALEKFPEGEYAPIYLGVGESTLAKEFGLTGDNLEGEVTLNSTEELEVPNLGELIVVSLDVEISKGTAGRWSFKEVELGFANREKLMEAIRHR